MAIFKKRSEDFEDEEDNEDQISPRRFKDLNPQNKKKRKEPQKPWGRRERLLIISILLATVIVSIAISFSAQGWKLPGLPKLTLPSFNFFNGETIIIEK